MAWVGWLSSGNSLPLKRCLALCVPTNQKANVHTGLGVNSACTPTATWEAKIKVLLQLDASGRNCTNRTFQLQPHNARNSVCISRACMTGIVSGCTLPTFAGPSTCETFFAFAFALAPSWEGSIFRVLALSRAISFAFPFRRLWLALAIPLGWLVPLPVLFPFHGFAPLPGAFDVLDFAPAPSGI